MKTLIAIIALLYPILASGIDQISLKECYQASLRQSVAYQTDQEKLVELDAKLSEAEAARFPTLNAAGSLTHNGNVQTISLGKSSFQVLPDNSLRFGLAATGIIFDGRRLETAANLQRESARLTEIDVEKVEQELASSVTSAYWSWVLSIHTEGITRTSAKSAQDHLDLVKKRYDAGQISRFEVIRAEVQRDQFNTNASNATSNRRRATQVLAFVTGLPITDDSTPADALNDKAFAATFDIAFETAKCNRVEYKLVQQASSLAAQGIKINEAGLYPLATANAGLNWANGANMTDPDKLINSWSVGVGVSYSIFDFGQTRARIEAAKSQRRQSELSRLTLDQVISNDVQLGIIALKDARAKIDLQASYAAQAEEALRLAKESFAVGQVTSQDVADAELALASAKLSQVQALYEWTMAVASLKRATGELRSELR